MCPGPRFTNAAINVEAGRKQICTEYEKVVVSKWFDHGGQDGKPFETETKGNARSVFTATRPPFFQNVTYYEG